MDIDCGGEANLPVGSRNDGDPKNSNVNISDVIEAIAIADPSFQPQPSAADVMFPTSQPQPPEQRPYVRILEQPASKALRFRYECEGRSAGSIPGANSTSENKTYPTIEIVGYKGRAVVVVSCVTKDKPYKPHPHNLVGRELCKNGVCTVNVPENMVVSFQNLGIQCVKKRDIEEALKTRESIRVDPFKTGFGHKSQAQGIDLNAVRLCFQVFLEHKGKIRHALPPAVSDIIYDKKAMNDLVITRLSHCSASVAGGGKVILLCEKVAKEDIAVTFFEVNNGNIVWQADAAELFVHKQVAIAFTTPRYHNIHVTNHVKVNIQLRRPTDNERSEPIPFELIPVSASDPIVKKRKRLDPNFSFMHHEQELKPPIYQDEYYNVGNIGHDSKIKLEPRERASSLSVASPPAPLFAPGASLLPPMDHYQQWTQLGVPGPSQQYTPNMNWPQNVGQVLDPAIAHGSPGMSPMSPNMGYVSPIMGHISPSMSHMSPGQMSVEQMSPNLAQMGSVSPNLPVQPSHLTQLQDANLMESTSSPSISKLLADADNVVLTDSEIIEFSKLTNNLWDQNLNPDQLTHSLTRLSTSNRSPE